MTTVAVRAPKYNPGFLTDDELVASFCVRTTEFEMLVEVLRECTGSSNAHQIVIGPRGSGKTSLLLRVAAEVRRDGVLAARCFPIVFAEESYEVATAGEFWLTCLTHLAAQAPRREDDPDLSRTVDELRTLRDDRTLADRCLGALLDFADRHDKRLLLVVENVNALFRDMTDRDAGWRLRKILQTEPRIIVFASATSRFDEIDHPDRALYDLFRVRTLRPLDTGQCAALWESVSGRRPAPETIRSLEILTGGSPRLISIVARFGVGRSFRDLMSDLFDLVDEHTEYFKGHIESLPAQERRVYLALATLWKPATAREVAEQSRLETSTCSAQLARLGERGVVQVVGGGARRKQYYLTERLYNIYYLLRRRRGPDRLVEALVRFMEAYYSPSELKDVGVGMARAVEDLDGEMRQLHRTALQRLLESPASRGADELLATALVNRGNVLVEMNRLEGAVIVYDEAIRRFGSSDTPAVREQVALALFGKGAALDGLNRPEEVLAVCDEVLARFGTREEPAFLFLVAATLVNKGDKLYRLRRSDDALAAWNEVVRRFGSSETPVVCEQVARALVMKGGALGFLNRPDDALGAYQEVVKLYAESGTPIVQELVAQALVNKGTLLSCLSRFEDSLAVGEEVVRRFETSPSPPLMAAVALALCNRALVIGRTGRSEEALAILRAVVRRLEQSEAPPLRSLTARVLFQRADMEIRCRQFEAGMETAGRLLERLSSDSVESLVAHLIRSEAALARGDRAECERDVEVVLGRLSAFDGLPFMVLGKLMDLGVGLGSERMRELIERSPAADRLLPFMTALEEDLGLQPRVAREVEAVAGDIRADMARRRKEGEERRAPEG